MEDKIVHFNGLEVLIPGSAAMNLQDIQEAASYGALGPAVANAELEMEDGNHLYFRQRLEAKG